MRELVAANGWRVVVGHSRMATAGACPRGVSVGHAWSQVSATSPDGKVIRELLIAHEDGSLLANRDDVTEAIAQALDLTVRR